MRRNRESIRDEIRGDRDGGRPCAYASAGNTNDERKPNGKSNKKHNSEGDLQGISKDKKRSFMGRKSVDEWILCEYCRTVRK